MEKQIFTQPTIESEAETFQPKQEFHQAKVLPDEPLEGELIDTQFEQAVKPQKRGWKTLLKLTALLFGAATVAQSVQWLIRTFQQNQWIYFAFALVSLVIVLFGVKEILGEWRRLVRLKKREQLRQQSGQWWLKSAVENQQDFSPKAAEQSKQQCLTVSKSLGLDEHSPAIVQWQAQLNDTYSASEIARLFSRDVLQSFDAKAKKLISKMAAESAVIVAVSPLAVVDMLFVAWRSLRLINQIAAIYGIELGYFTRIRLLRLVLLNMAFAGATEVAQEIGLDWLSQDITAKLSARAAQGIGVGLLTARLGIKAMAFCRPLEFQPQEKPKLAHIQKELLTTVKSVVLGKEKMKEKDMA